MKTIYLILSFVFLQYIGVSQTEQNTQNQNSKPTVVGCALIYLEDQGVLTLKETALPTCSDLVFETLPPVTQTLVPVRLALKKGSYSFKKNPDLSLPGGYTILIEDTMTGATFDFAKDDSMKFNVTRNVPDRFVMFVSKAKNSIAVK